MTEKTIFELSKSGRRGITFPASDVPETAFPENLRRSHLHLPELSELDVVRHFNHLPKMNYSID